ncbi:MAG: hypothetical protein JXA49_08555 [Actinobacteria bacterium]|nr:hypothetical protein [Actinomycetota bacterium]
MRNARMTALVALLFCLIAACLFAAGCGGSNSPQATVEDIVRAVRGGDTKTAEGLFDNQGDLAFFEETLPDAAMPAIGKVETTGEESATVEVLLNPMRAEEGGFVFLMRKSGDSWRVAGIKIDEGI